MSNSDRPKGLFGVDWRRQYYRVDRSHRAQRRTFLVRRAFHGAEVSIGKCKKIVKCIHFHIPNYLPKETTAEAKAATDTAGGISVAGKMLPAQHAYLPNDAHS